MTFRSEIKTDEDARQYLEYKHPGRVIAYQVVTPGGCIHTYVPYLPGVAETSGKVSNHLIQLGHRVRGNLTLSTQ